MKHHTPAHRHRQRHWPRRLITRKTCAGRCLGVSSMDSKPSLHNCTQRLPLSRFLMTHLLRHNRMPVSHRGRLTGVPPVPTLRRSPRRRISIVRAQSTPRLHGLNTRLGFSLKVAADTVSTNVEIAVDYYTVLKARRVNSAEVPQFAITSEVMDWRLSCSNEAMRTSCVMSPILDIPKTP